MTHQSVFHDYKTHTLIFHQAFAHCQGHTKFTTSVGAGIMCTYYSIMARLGAIICRQDADHWIDRKEFMRIDLDAWHLSATNKLGFVLQYCN